MAARIGLWLGICFGVCFLTGLVSHYAQNPGQPIPFPTSPSWGYRVTQGLHVLTGVAAVPLLLVKLWTVYPRLFLRLAARSPRDWSSTPLERGSIAVLVASAIFQLATGLANITRWYPWDFSFRSTHYALAWVAIGSLLVHIAVKLPIIRDMLRGDMDAPSTTAPSATEPGVLTRRGLLRTTWLAAGVAVLANAGASVPFLRELSVFAVNSGDGPQGIPINKTAAEAASPRAPRPADYRLEIVYDGRATGLTREELRGDGAAHRDPADRLRRGVERLGDLDRRAAARPARPRRRPAADATSRVGRCSRPAPSGTPCCRATSPTTTAPCWRWGSTASRSPSTTGTPAG